MAYEYLKKELPDTGIALIALNRPEKRNALSTQLRHEIVDCLGELEADDSVRVVILTGEGPSFCAGFDLKEFETGDSESIFKQATEYHRVVYTFPKPLIAAVNGPAFAGGMDLAAMCDLRVASENASFAQPQVRMGVPAAYDLISRVLPQSLARELCLTGRTMGLEEARACGFVNTIVAPDQLLAETIVLAREISDALASQSMKRQFVENQPDLFTN
ncbi:MAG: enoyl-CoA hydratase/isomerase family protein [Gammaproteobacteria bacterium]|nr:enoyl-CoA hydratase/isomerase family protein [Gammaproteobacteria bacterium]